jgi:hypothetical protein
MLSNVAPGLMGLLVESVGNGRTALKAEFRKV